MGRLEITAKCAKCKKSLPRDQFHSDKSKSNGCSSYCKLCKKQYKHDWEQANREKQNDWWNKRRAKNIAALKALKAERGCKNCSEKDPTVLQFHHRSGAEKLYNLGDAVRSLGMEKLLIEVEKCDVLCANCHLRLHYGG